MSNAKKPWEWTEEDVLRLIGQSESVTLEFKQGRGLEESDPKKWTDMLTKYASAFANSSGGALVIGVSENKRTHVAEEIDGVDYDSCDQQRLLQIVEGNLRPALAGIRIRKILMGSGRGVIVLWVPQGTTAYQASDHIYYGRSDFTTRALPDHEVRLRMQRGSSAQCAVIVGSVIKRSDYNRSAEQWNAAKDQTEHLPVLEDKYEVQLRLVNTGEKTLREFVVCLEATPPLTHQTVHVAAPAVQGQKPTAVPVQVRNETAYAIEGLGRARFPSRPFQADRPFGVLPGDRLDLPTVVVRINDPAACEEPSLLLSWRVFIDNAPPCEGELDLREELAAAVLAEEPARLPRLELE